MSEQPEPETLAQAWEMLRDTIPAPLHEIARMAYYSGAYTLKELIMRGNEQDVSALMEELDSVETEVVFTEDHRMPKQKTPTYAIGHYEPETRDGSTFAEQDIDLKWPSAGKPYGPRPPNMHSAKIRVYGADCQDIARAIVVALNASFSEKGKSFPQMIQVTEGEWFAFPADYMRALGNTPLPIFVIGPSEFCTVAQVRAGSEDDDLPRQTKANARLLAAAPTMRAALGTAREVIETELNVALSSYSSPSIVSPEEQRANLDPDEKEHVAELDDAIEAIDAALAKARFE